MSEIRILQQGARVVMVINGSRVEDMPHAVALRLSTALASVAKQAEEWDNAERIAADQALLMRTNAPFGLSDHPMIRAEAAKLAVYDRCLRRYLPRARVTGIRSTETFGVPTLRQTPPKEPSL